MDSKKKRRLRLGQCRKNSHMIQKGAEEGQQMIEGEKRRRDCIISNEGR